LKIFTIELLKSIDLFSRIPKLGRHEYSWQAKLNFLSLSPSFVVLDFVPGFSRSGIPALNARSV